MTKEDKRFLIKLFILKDKRNIGWDNRPEYSVPGWKETTNDINEAVDLWLIEIGEYEED